MWAVGGKSVDFRHAGMGSKNETQVAMRGVTGTAVAKEVGICFHRKGWGGKKGYLHPSKAHRRSTLVSLCGEACAHAVQAVPPLGGCKARFLRRSGQLFLHCMEGNRREDKEKRKMSPLYVTNTVGLRMIQHRQHGYLKYLQIYQMKHRRNVKHLPCVFQKKWKHCFLAWILLAFLYCAEKRLLCPLVGRSTAAKPAVVHGSTLLSTAPTVAAR